MDVVSGQRSAVVGFVVEASRALSVCGDDAADEGDYNAAARRALRASARWSDYVADDGGWESGWR